LVNSTPRSSEVQPEGGAIISTVASFSFVLSFWNRPLISRIPV
jgi:hypothetical protein